MKHIWIGMDTGGTFTDLVLAELTTGTYHDHQLPSPSDPD
jgi:N-methylhydantoinase A/oxoprolinase/acetone carboxylase beta subunit